MQLDGVIWKHFDFEKAPSEPPVPNYVHRVTNTPHSKSTKLVKLLLLDDRRNSEVRKMMEVMSMYDNEW